MCGIIGGFNIGKKSEEPVNEWVIHQFEDQKNRGSNGFGVIFIEKDGSYQVKRATEITKCFMDIYKKEVSMMLMHHRIPTSSQNKMLQTHPMIVDNGSLKYKYLIIHNGIIKNADKMRKKHEELGFVYGTLQSKNEYYDEYNDSESLAIEIARFMEGQIKEIETTGSAALIGAQIDKKKDKIIKIFFNRNDGNPLHMSKTRDKIRLSSEGEGDNTKEDILYSFNLKDFKLKKQTMKIDEQKYEYCGYSSHHPHSPYYNSSEERTMHAYNHGTKRFEEINSETENAPDLDEPSWEYTAIMDTAEEEIGEVFDKMELTELVEKLETNIKEEAEVFQLDIGSIIRVFAARIQKIIDFAQTRMSLAIADQEELIEKEALEKQGKKDEGIKNKETKQETITGFDDLDDPDNPYPDNPNNPDYLNNLDEKPPTLLQQETDEKIHPHHPSCVCTTCKPKATFFEHHKIPFV